MSDTLHFHDASVHWLRYNDKFYKWTTGKGYQPIDAETAPDLTNFHVVTIPAQLEALKRGLRDNDLIE